MTQKEGGGKWGQRRFIYIRISKCREHPCPEGGSEGVTQKGGAGTCAQLGSSGHRGVSFTFEQGKMGQVYYAARVSRADLRKTGRRVPAKAAVYPPRA